MGGRPPASSFHQHFRCPPCSPLMPEREMKTETAIEALFNTDCKTCTVQNVQKKRRETKTKIKKNEKGFLMSQVANTSSSLSPSLSVCACVRTCVCNDAHSLRFCASVFARNKPFAFEVPFGRHANVASRQSPVAIAGCQFALLL